MPVSVATLILLKKEEIFMYNDIVLATSMRNVIARISAINHLNLDNKELGLKAGDIVTYKLDELVSMLDEWASTKKFNDIHRYHECISTARRNVKNLLQRKMSRSIITKILEKPCSGVHF